MILKITNKKKWIGLLIGGIFLFLTFKNFKYNEFANIVKSFNFIYIPIFLFFHFLTFVLRSIRWKVILLNLKDISLYRLISTIFIGQLINNIFPAHLGELARSYIIGVKENISKSSSFASIVLERVLDGVTLIFLLCAVSFLIPFPLWTKKIIIISVVVFGTVLLFLIINIYKSYYILVQAKKLFPVRWHNKFDRLIPLFERFVQGLVVLTNFKQLTIVLFLSLSIWTCEAVVYWVMLKAMNIVLPLYAPLFILSSANLSTTIPSMPGNIGSFDYVCMVAVSIFGASKDASLVYAISIHGFEYLFQIFIGLLFLVQMRFTLREFHELHSNDVIRRALRSDKYIIKK